MSKKSTSIENCLFDASIAYDPIHSNGKQKWNTCVMIWKVPISMKALFRRKQKKMHKLISLKIDFDLSESLPIYYFR